MENYKHNSESEERTLEQKLKEYQEQTKTDEDKVLETQKERSDSQTNLNAYYD